MQSCLNICEEICPDKLRIMHDRILRWGKENMRQYPWRETRDGYKIIIAETMLHRTRADQVREVYEEFIRKYPDFGSIVDAGPEKVREELGSLGLVWRADLLYKMAEAVMREHAGVLPLEKEELMNFPGIGPYISSAVLCMAYNLPEPLIDTNTVRVIGRFLGIKITDSSRRSDKFKKIMSELASYGKPRDFSISLIDFAALICTAGNPECSECTLNDACNYYITGVVQ